MQYLNPNSYVQYITANGVIKVKEVERQVESNEIIYNLYGINEDFFILGVYDLNKRVLGVTFGNVENLEMIAFLNSDFQSVEALPKNSFFPPNTFVSIFKDTVNYDINFNPVLPQNYNCNELLYLDYFCKQKYSGSFEIQPFCIGIGSNFPQNQISDNFGQNVLYFCYLQNSQTYNLINAAQGQMSFDASPLLEVNPSVGWHFFTHLLPIANVPSDNMYLYGFQIVFAEQIFTAVA
jgi:hypothetical protein